MNNVTPAISISFATQAEVLAKANGVTLPLADQARLFLAYAWSAMPQGELVGLVGQTSYLDKRARQYKMTATPLWLHWPGDLPALLDQAEKINQQNWPGVPGAGGIYWQGASRKASVLARYGGRGSLTELVYASAFWADLDAAKRGYDLQTGIKALLAMPLPPTFIIFSGGGLQPVHVLSKPWVVSNLAATQEYKAYSLALYGEAFSAVGLQADKSVAEASRMMRLPGFINRKPDRNTPARIVYFNPTARYSPDQIRDAITLPQPIARAYIPPPQVPGTYQVDQTFVHHLITDKEAIPPERHPTLLALAMCAARAGIPLDIMLEQLRPIARRWFAATGEAYRAEIGGDFDRVIIWSYERVAEDPQSHPAGFWLVKLGTDGFEKVEDAALEKLRSRVLEIRTLREANTTAARQLLESLPVVSAPDPETPTSDLGLVSAVQATLDDTRESMLTALREYLNNKQPHGLGTYMLMQAAPGSGKTHAVLQAAQEVALKDKDEPAVALLTLFKFEETNWQAYLMSFGVDPRLGGYLVGRNGDPTSAGYCQLHVQAEMVARKNHNVVGTLCARCPAHTDCEERWYLAQFTEADRHPILIARHQHGYIDDLVDSRKMIIFDESPLGVVSQPLSLVPGDLMILPPLAAYDQYPAELKLIQAFLDALKRVLLLNAVPQEASRKIAESHTHLGGHWLMARLTVELGSAEKLQALADLEPEVITLAGQHTLRDISPEAVGQLPVNYLTELHGIFRHEYHTHYQAGNSAWNSRLIPAGNTLHVYPMSPYTFTQNTRVIVTDATADPSLYGKALAYTRSKTVELDTGEKQKLITRLPRAGHIYEASLARHARIIQFTDSSNSRRAFRDSKQDSIEDAEGNTLDIELDSRALERTKEQILHLGSKHQGRLLVVTYRAEAQKLRAWARQVTPAMGGLAGLDDPAEQINWFGNLRGKNDYKDLDAVLIAGTPRIPPQELLIQAQVWHWQEALPISADRMARLALYPGDPGQRAYQYLGYADERLDRLYRSLVAGELRQCYERIRPDAPSKPDQEKYVYLATDFPCADRVDVLCEWSEWITDDVGRTWYEGKLQAGQPVAQSDYARHIQDTLGHVWVTGKRSFERVHGQLQSEKKIENAGITRTKLQIALDWLENPSNTGASLVQGSRETGVSENTVRRAKRLLEGDKPLVQK